MTNEEKIEIFAMRLNGATLQEIGMEYGITKERVRQILNVSERRRKIPSENWIYPNLAEYIEKNNDTLISMAKKCEITPITFGYYIRGQRMPALDTIRKILKITGMTFEEAFQVKEDKYDK